MDNKGELCRTAGKYKIDELAYLFAKSTSKTNFDKLSLSDKQPYVALLRGQINRTAKIALTRAENDRKDNSTSRKTALRLLKTLARIDKLTAWLPGDEAATMAADLSRVFKARPSTTVIPSIVSIIEDIRSINDWGDHLRKNFEIVLPRPNRVDLFGRHFVKEAINFYQHYIRKSPPATRSSPFVDLLAYAWADLQLPMTCGKNVMEHEDLCSLLGSKVETEIKLIKNNKSRS